jgi:hypothetical protein
MEFRTPLLDCFRRGDVPRDVRMLAARGALAPRAQEQLALLVLLVKDVDKEIAGTASETIDKLPPAPLARFIARTDTPEDVRTFFTKRGVAPTRAATDDEPLIPNADDVDDEEALVAAAVRDAEKTADGDEKKVVAILTSLSVPQRLKIALKGTREQRSVLVRDPNKMVSAAVLSSPKLTDMEVESFARMGNVSEDVLRTIGMSRAWTQNYCVCAALVRNAKTPLAISMSLLPRLNDRDVKVLVTDRNVPEGLRLAARKVVQNQEARKQ